MSSSQAASKTVDLALGGDGSESEGEDEPTTVRYLEAGAGPPVVLLHGVGLDAAHVSWKHAIPALADDYRVLAPDLPGHGESDKPDVDYTTDYYIDVLAAFVDELGLEGVSLAGISMGGGIALGYALDNEIERLALVDSYGLGSDAFWRPAATMALRTPGVDRLLWEGMGINEGTVRDTLRGYVTQADDAFVTELHDLLQDEDCGRTLRRWQRSEFRTFGFRTCYLDELSEMEVPTLLVHGDDDPLLPSSWSQRADDRLPDSELHLFEDCGHWPPRERPVTFNRVLSAFLAS